VAKQARDARLQAGERGADPGCEEGEAFDREAAIELVMKMMAIPGPSGQEGQVAQFIVDSLLAAGADPSQIRVDESHARTQLAGDTGNVLLQLPGTHRKPRRMLMAHMDTVPICVGSRPVREGNKVTSGNPGTGLGGDDRAGAAVVLHTALSILSRRLPHPPLTFLWTIQEETGLEGARHVRKADLGRVAYAFNWDGGAAEKVTIGATGGYRMAIDVRGLASHAGGAPQHGISAIAIAALAIAQLHRDGWHGAIHKGRQEGTSNVGFIQGGDATNVVTDYVRLKAEARSHDPKFRARIVREIEKAFHKAAKSVRNAAGKSGRIEFEGQLDYESFRLERHDKCVQAAVAAMERFGWEPELAISNGGLDANWMYQHGIPTVTLGCGQKNIHTVSEELDLEGYCRACSIALWLATAERLPA
jgi:tripeptide aminopeptidase